MSAEYGGLTRGPRVVNADTKAEMKRILGEIQDGTFAKEWVAEAEKRENYKKLQQEQADHQIEETGAKMRALMPWVQRKITETA